METMRDVDRQVVEICHFSSYASEFKNLQAVTDTDNLVCTNCRLTIRPAKCQAHADKQASNIKAIDGYNLNTNIQTLRVKPMLLARQLAGNHQLNNTGLERQEAEQGRYELNTSIV